MNPTTQILCGDWIEQLRTLRAQSVHTVVTSPPYYGLRDYGVPGQLGLEETPEAYVAKLVEGFREVRRVLRDDGTLWLNLGDSYASGEVGRKDNGRLEKDHDKWSQPMEGQQPRTERRHGCITGLPPKNLLGIPWRVAFALQADGWVLRQEIIWHKPSPMPSSVRDRCTTAHEQLFLFCKAEWVGPQPGRFAHVVDSDARWAAAMIDTEGSIVIKRGKKPGRADAYAPQVSIGNTNRALLERLASIFGHGNILERPGTNAPMFYWQVAHSLARDFLRRIYPFLIVKRRQARIGIHVAELTYHRGGRKLNRKSRTEAESRVLESMWERCKQCNRFGDPELSDVPEPRFGRYTCAFRYYYDAEAIKEEAVTAGRIGGFTGCQAFGLGVEPTGNQIPENGRNYVRPEHRNKRSVWTIPPKPYKGAHFACFPPKLVEPCILAGTSAMGCCATCGKPAERVIERTRVATRPGITSKLHDVDEACDDVASVVGNRDPERHVTETRTVDWQLDCPCEEANLTPCTVLDPFAGSGTTGQVAREHGRSFVGIELNPGYLPLIRQRLGSEGAGS